MNFDSHMRKISEKSGQKLNPLSRKSTFLNKNPKRVIFDAMILAMFGGGDIHNISNFPIIANGNKNTVRHGLETLCYRTP